MTIFGRPLWYDRQGVPIDAATYGRLRLDDTYCRVARTTVASAADPAVACAVSTVWVGLDSWMGGFSDRPIIFETMVFSDEQMTVFVDEQTRYATEEAALAGHEEMVAAMAARIDDPVVTHDEIPARADIIDQIDNAIGCFRCGTPLGESPSSDFCSQRCQSAWHSSRTQPLVGYQEPVDLPVHVSNQVEIASPEITPRRRSALVFELNVDTAAVAAAFDGVRSQMAGLQDVAIRVSGTFQRFQRAFLEEVVEESPRERPGAPPTVW